MNRGDPRALNAMLATLPVTPVVASAGATSARVQVSPTSVNLAAGAATTVTVSLTGTRPAPGAYEGFVDVTGGIEQKVPQQHARRGVVFDDQGDWTHTHHE